MTFSSVNLRDTKSRQVKIPAVAKNGQANLCGPEIRETDVRDLFNTTQKAVDREDFRLANNLFQQAASLPGGAEMWRWKSLGFCPTVFSDEKSIHLYREKLNRSLDLLFHENPRLDWRTALQDGFTPSFNLPHHGICCREIKEKFGAYFEKHFPFDKPSLKETRKGRSKIHVGFFVTAGHHHGFLHVNKKILRRLDQKKFEIHVICPKEIVDECRRKIASANIRYVGFSGAFENLAQQLKELKLDILYHWKVGGGVLDYFVPYLRAAPIQCVSLGSHGTSGVPCIDYFLSYNGFEHTGSEYSYTETLYSMDAYPTIHEPGPSVPATTRDEFGLPSRGAIYFCPHRLAKYHPCFDSYIRDILEGDSTGHIVMLIGHKKHLAEQLRNRLKAGLGDTLTRRIIFVQQLGLNEYRKLLSLATCVLDSPVYAGDLTTHDALEQGIPVVTRQGRLLVENYTSALYRSIGMSELIADDRENYVQIALRLGKESDYRQIVQDRIFENRDRLFSHENTIREYERFFETAMEMQ